VTRSCFLSSPFFLFCLLAAPSGNRLFAQQLPEAPIAASDSEIAERDAAANRYIHDLLPYWQKRLQLEDWNVYILLSRPADLRPGTVGNIHWDREKKSATIRVMDASGYTSDDVTAMFKDMQVTVVHELVHLELASLPVSDADRSNQEYAIDHLTDALLAADH
jgi:hypothetical protein